ncbi:MAG: metallophosphoesterase [Erysipelotrichaceae bacterium]|nr:metallophosphoesterase [Erysipelotrichaceae bacterium]
MRTYCISDIHGHYKNFAAFKSTLKEDDLVYVLGDVIDKGEDSIKILLEIIADKRFKMLLGNHEYMMWQFLSANKKSLEFLAYKDAWIKYNSGLKTFVDYVKLSKDKQKLIYDFISELPVNFPDVEVNGKKFYLVHSYFKEDRKLYLKDFGNNEEINEYIWKRVDPKKVDIDIGKTVIAGHTPNLYFTYNMEPVGNKTDLNKSTYIDIDGSLAANKRLGTLIALCLDDLTFKTY